MAGAHDPAWLAALLGELAEKAPLASEEPARAHGEIPKKLMLHARSLRIRHPNGTYLAVTAPLPPHMQQTWNLLGFDATRYDPIVEAPEE